MGKQSRLKKLRYQQNQENSQKEKEVYKATDWWEKLLLGIVKIGAGLALITPLVYNAKYYFPFVGPKSLYFMAFCQIVFFAWLILALYKKQYRPQKNAVAIALAVFVFFMALSAVFGVDPSRSFWSKFERMTGVLMWFNLFGFFLAVSSSLKKWADWKNIFLFSLGVAFVVSVMGILEKYGVKQVIFSDRMGATLGNTSFLGSYLIFNFFLSWYLLTQEKRLLFKVLFGALAVLMFSAIYLQGARAATGVSIAGLVLVALLFWAFKIKNKIWSIIGKIALGVSVLAVIVSIILLYLPNNPVHNQFGKMATQGRFANWEIAEKGFLERPFFGWGPETYDILFPKYFNPCLFLAKCGGEFWFDRTHNIILDTLVSGGALGLLAYLGIFATLIFILSKKYFKEKSIDFWTFALFVAMFVAYFVQNLTVFDMVSSLMMFVLMLAFIAFLAVFQQPHRISNRLNVQSKWGLAVLMVIFALSFNFFVYKPWQLDKMIIKAAQTQYQDDRLALYDKTLQTSSLGKYQVTDFFADHSQRLVQNNIKNINTEGGIKELDWAIKETEKRHNDSLLDYRIVLKLAQLYNAIVLLDSSKLPLAEQYGKKAMELSPKNQQSYWVLAQTELFLQDFEAAKELSQKAIDLEPELLRSYEVAVQVAMVSGDKDTAVEIAKRAVKINKDWVSSFSGILPQAATSSQDLTK